MLALPASTPAVIGVAETEWRITVYRPSVRRGRINFHVHDFGQDAHDLAVRGPGGYRSATSTMVRSGGDVVLKVTLRRPGTYTLYCTIPGHEARGMSATIRVR